MLHVLGGGSTDVYAMVLNANAKCYSATRPKSAMGQVFRSTVKQELSWHRIATHRILIALRSVIRKVQREAWKIVSEVDPHSCRP